MIRNLPLKKHVNNLSLEVATSLAGGKQPELASRTGVELAPPSRTGVELAPPSCTFSKPSSSHSGVNLNLRQHYHPQPSRYGPCPRFTPFLPLPLLPPTFNRFSMPPWTRMRKRQKQSFSLTPGRSHRMGFSFFPPARVPTRSSTSEAKIQIQIQSRRKCPAGV
jgi:hypothetical protein